MYNIIVSNQFENGFPRSFRIEKSRFLEYTNDSIKNQLSILTADAIECIKSWPCILMTEGKTGENAVFACITELRDSGTEIIVSIADLHPSCHIQNADLWRIREELDIGQFEFSRYHWAIKERDLLSTLHNARYAVDCAIASSIDERPLPAPNRISLLRSRDVISNWSHTEIDDFLLETGIPDLSAGRDKGSRRDRANAIVQFAIENPSAATAENSLFTAFLVRRAPAEKVGSQTELATPIQLVTPVRATNQSDPDNRPPNRVFVVHGQNEAARAEVVSFLDELGLVGIVLHEQANMGRHLLTKFIEEAELVTFAVVLMTNDDVGSLRGGNLAPRARQNVILELGYFLSHLGQERVCALISPGLETPSDFDGIVYIRMEASQQWQQELKRELLAARMPIIS